MTPEQIRRAKAIIEHAAVHSLETEEIQLLGWALQRIAELEAGQGSAGADLADLIRKRYPRLLERGNPLYDGTLDDAIGRIKEGGPIEAGRVVVAELTNDDELEAFNGHRDPTEDEIHALRIGYALAVSRTRAIPADRVLEARAVVVPDDTFTLDLDEFGKSLVCITINSKNRGVGYELCGTMGDGHFSRRTFDITPYLAHCLNTIGVRAIPAGRVLGEGQVPVDREEIAILREIAGRWLPPFGVPHNSETVEIFDRLHALRSGEKKGGET